MPIEHAVIKPDNKNTQISVKYYAELGWAPVIPEEEKQKQ